MTPFSARISAEILASVPEWAAFAREELGNDGLRHLVIDVPAPEGSDLAQGLRIDTANDEVTVSFDHFHGHFERWGVAERGMEHEAASIFVYALIGEAIVVASAWDGDRWCGSCELEVGEELDLSFRREATRLRVRSWTGRLDEDRAL